MSTRDRPLEAAAKALYEALGKPQGAFEKDVPRKGLRTYRQWEWEELGEEDQREHCELARAALDAAEATRQIERTHPETDAEREADEWADDEWHTDENGQVIGGAPPNFVFVAKSALDAARNDSVIPSSGIHHKGGPVAQILQAADWLEGEGPDGRPDDETLGKVAANLRAAVDALPVAGVRVGTGALVDCERVLEQAQDDLAQETTDRERAEATRTPQETGEVEAWKRRFGGGMLPFDEAYWRVRKSGATIAEAQQAGVYAVLDAFAAARPVPQEPGEADEREWSLWCENYVWRAKAWEGVGVAKSTEPITVVPKSRLLYEITVDSTGLGW